MRRLLIIAILMMVSLTSAAQISRNPCINFPCPCGQHCTSPLDVPYCVPDAGSCSVTTSYLHGAMDAFAAPVDATTPSAALLAFLGPTRSQYDTPGCNRHFGDSFQLATCLRCKFCGAKVEIHLKPCNGNASNDNYTIGVAPFGTAGTIASGRIWPSGTPAETTLTIDLPASNLNQLFCKGKKQPTLDVYIEDDTIVDWVRLTIYSQ